MDFNKILATYAEEHRVAEALKGMPVRTETIPSDKIGFNFLVTYVNDVEVKKEYVSNGEELPTPSGDYLHPIPYEEGMEVETGKWYTDGDNIWEAIADGIPASFEDTDYFDIVG